MPQNDHSQGGQQQHDAKKEQKQHPAEQKKPQQSGDYTTNVWHKIQGSVAKDKINNFKQEIGASNPGGSFKKKRRRRRRKKHHEGGAPMPGAVQQQKVEHQSKPQDQAQVKHHVQPHVQPHAQTHVQPVVAVPVEPRIEELPPEPSPFDVDGEDDVPHVVDEPVEQTEPIVQPESVDEPQEVAQPQEVEQPEEPVAQPEPVAPPLEPEEIPPTPPVQPINPFDFAPPENPFAKKGIEDDDQQDKQFKTEETKPINPFDLTDPATSIDDKKEAEKHHPTAHLDQGVYSEYSSPEDSGEAKESSAVNMTDEADDFGASDGEEADLPEKEEVIEVKPEDVQERKIEPVFPEKIPENTEPGLTHDEFRDDIWTVLAQAGITKKKLIIGLIALGVIILGAIFFIFGGLKIFDFGGDAPVARSPTEVVDAPVQVTGEKMEPEKPYDVIAAYIFGQEFQPGSNPIEAEPIGSFGDSGSIDASLIFGQVDNLKQVQFVEYVQLLEKMNNVYNVDIYSLLDLSVNRRAALNQYLQEVDALINDGKAALLNVEANLKEFNLQYDAAIKQANAFENGFFSYVQNFYGQTAYDNLQSFIDTSNEAGRIKAQHAAENTLRTMLINSLNALQPRYQDIATNTDALIKGVKVFDLPASDINAIIPVR